MLKYNKYLNIYSSIEFGILNFKKHMKIFMNE